jgi:hypothetical protein
MAFSIIKPFKIIYILQVENHLIFGGVILVVGQLFRSVVVFVF